MGLFDGLSNAVSGLSAQSQALNAISANIANASTAGFKSTDTRFADVLAQAQTGSAAGGVAVGARATLHLQGTVATTGTATNLAIAGDGYFVVRQNTGTAGSPSFTGEPAYTRRGDFTPDANGYLVNGAGYTLFAGPSGAPLHVATNAATAFTGLSVSASGAVAATYADGSATAMGPMTLAHFGTEDGLAPLDGGAYAATDRSGDPTFGMGGATVTGGAVEQSDVSVSDQFSKLIETQQAYTANTRVMDVTNEMLQDAITMYV